MMNWTPEEQNMLKTLKESQENLSWAAISKSLIKMFQDKYHTPKQCRERYINYVRFQRNDQKFLKWSKEEEDLLYNLYQKIGSNWNKIGESFDYKSENTIKNKFYGNLRKLLRRLNAIGKSTRKLRKELRYQSLIRPLQISQSQIKDSQLIEMAIGLRGRLIGFLRNNFDNLTQDTALNFIEHVNKFNLQSRSMSRKRYKKECEIDDDQKKDQRKSSENKEDRNVQNGDCKIEEVIQELHVKVQEQEGVEKMAQPTSKEYQIKRENNIIVSGNWNINSNHTYPIMNSPLPFNFTFGCFPYSNHILNMMTMHQFSENIAQMYPKSYNNNITNSTRSTSLEIQNPIGSSFRRIQPQ